MKRFVAVSLLFLCSSLAVALQDAEKPQISKVSLTKERIAVYSAFFADFHRDSEAIINLSELTGPLRPDEGDFSGCMKGFIAGSEAIKVHDLRSVFKQKSGIRLVDPEKYEIDDPWDRIRRGDSVDNAVRAGEAAGLLGVSEIIFDQTHHHAALNYSFRCGRLCGHGETVIYDLRHGRWHRAKQSCGFWQS